MSRELILKVVNFGGDYGLSEPVYEIKAWQEVNDLIAEDSFPVTTRGLAPLMRGLKWL